MASLNKLVEEINLQIEELAKLKNEAKLPTVQAFLQNELNRLTLSKQNYEKELIKIPSTESKSKELGVITISNYMWDQTEEYVKIYIELDKNDKIDNSELSLKFPSDTKFTCVFGKYRFTLSNLFKPINEKKSKAVLTKSNRLIMTLYKLHPGNWSSLQLAETKKPLDNKNDIDTADPEKTLMNLMKKIYDEGDDEMKRTIAKSLYESRHKQGIMD